ncbi:hypothetical protein KM043_002365 [Ampulex compressa]|nr:hypothetical protein KM043_002365 [Ampulex compressa]
MTGERGGKRVRGIVVVVEANAPDEKVVPGARRSGQYFTIQHHPPGVPTRPPLRQHYLAGSSSTANPWRKRGTWEGEEEIQMRPRGCQGAQPVENTP